MYFGIECESLQKYKGIKLQKCLLACKKGINVVVVLMLLPPKRCPRGRFLHPQPPQSVFEEDKAEEATESSFSKCWVG